MYNGKRANIAVLGSRQPGHVIGIVVATALVCVAAGAVLASYPLIVVGLPTVILAIYAVGYFFRDPIGVLLAFFLFEIIQPSLAAFVGYSNTPGLLVQRSSEVMMLILLVLALLNQRGRMGKLLSLYVVGGVVFAAAGLLSAFQQHVPSSVFLIGTWLQIKFWVLLCVGLLVPWTERDKVRVLNTMMLTGLVLSVLGLVDLVAQQPFRAFLHTNTVSLTFDPRRTLAVESIFTTPSQFGIVMAMLMAVALAAMVTRQQGRRYGFYAATFAVMAMLSLRVSTLIAVLATGFVVWMLANRSFGRRALGVISLAALAMILVSLFSSEINSHIETYSNSDANARGKLYVTSTVIAKQHEPLGSGFGTFASGESRQHYSPLYNVYGLSGTYGLSREHPAFIDDTMWPAILGEAGYIGLAAVILGLLAITHALLLRVREATSADRMTFPLAATGTLLVGLINSIASPVLFSGLYAVIVVLVAVPALTVTVTERRQAVSRAFHLYDRDRPRRERLLAGRDWA
jgi:hypothetical protein